jgi:hypothetical protein
MEFISYVSVYDNLAHLLLRRGDEYGKLGKIGRYERS